jgi:branched-chain amino acid transport system substrate-binding protein
MFSKEIEQSNVQVVLAEKYSKDQTSFNSELTKIKELKSDVLILAGFPKEIGLAIKQARELGIDSQMFAHSGSVGSDLYQAAGIHADGLINLTELDNTESNKSYQEFKEIFLNKFGSSPDLINSLAYDALGILVTGLESCNKNISAQCVRDEIKNLKNYAGVTGLTTFDQNGDPMDRGLICVKKNITLDAENKLVIKDVSCLE